jgi:hypothetical protein
LNRPAGTLYPIQPADTVTIGHKGIIVSDFVDGQMDLHSDSNGTYLPLKEQIQPRLDAIWDMAGLTKLLNIVAALKKLDKGILG